MERPKLYCTEVEIEEPKLRKNKSKIRPSQEDKNEIFKYKSIESPRRKQNVGLNGRNKLERKSVTQNLKKELPLCKLNRKISTTSLASDYMHDTEDHELRLEEENSSHCVRVYNNICNRLGIPVTSCLQKSLETEEIIIKNKCLGPIGAKACAVALVANSSVRNLDLTGNGIGDQGAIYISEMLMENIFISSMSLSENNITSLGLQHLVSSLSASNLTSLNLAGNNFGEQDAKHIVTIIQSMPCLTKLILHHNCFGELGGQLIGPAIGKNTSLTELDLSWNHLRLNGAVAIAKGIEMNGGLEKVNLSWNGFNMKAANALASMIKNNKTMESLDLSSNRISKDSLCSILEGFKENSTIKVFKVGQNSLSADGAILILHLMKKYPTIAIQELDISGQTVDEDFINLLEELNMERETPIRAIHGVVFKHNDIKEEKNDVFSEEPLMVMMEFLKQSNLRLIDFFSRFDADNSKSLTRDEIKAGLLTVSIPLTAAALDKLLDKLDKDGDGEVDFSELMIAQKEFRRRKLLAQKQDDPVLAKIAHKISEILVSRPSSKIDTEPNTDKNSP